jgi:putative PEP-CTERM system TPR-repeat lipoprotein
MKCGLVFALSLIAFTSASCSKGQLSREDLLARANSAFAAEDYDKAEKDYREVLGVDPDDPLALRRLAAIYFDQGQLGRALPLLKRSAEFAPNDPEVQLKLCASLLSARQYQQARDAALLVLDKQPGNEQALVLLAGTAVAREDVEETKKLVETLRGTDQDRAGYHLALGRLALRQQEEATAESEFKAAVKLDPKSAEAYASLANLYWARNDLAAAEQNFKAAAEVSPLRSPLRVRYAEFKLRTGAVAEAKNILREITARYADYLPARVYAMKIACGEHQDEDCTTRVQHILAQDAANYDALHLDGLLNLTKGDATKAIHDFEYLSNANDRDAEVRYRLAVAYLSSAKRASLAETRNAVEAAESRLTEAVKIDSNFEPAVLLLAELKIRKGSAAAAVDALAPLIRAQTRTAQAYYLLASAYLAQGRAAQALAVYAQMLQLYPKDPQPPFLIGSALLAQRQLAEARKAFERSTEIADYLPALERLVDLDINEKNYAAAAERVQRQINKNPKTAQAWALRGKISAAQQDFARAEPDLLKAIELDQTLEPAYMLLAQIYLASGKQKEAIAKLNAFLDQRNDVPALMQLAAIHEQMKNYPAARDAYQALLTVAPNSLAALNNLAVIYSEHLGDFDKAYELAKRGRDVAPNEPHAADTLGWVLFRKGDYANALPLAQESAAKLPDLAEVQFHLGMTRYMLGQEAPARIALQKAVDAGADFPGKDEALARLSLMATDFASAGARNKLENYLREHPNDPAALTRLAAFEQRDSNVGQAIKTYEKVLAANPDFAPATRALAILYGQQGGAVAKAYDLAVSARQAYPGDPEVAKAFGVLSYRQGYYPKAIEVLNEVATKRNDDSEALFYLGEAYHEMKQWKECTAVLGRALYLNSLPEQLAEQAKRSLADCS